MRASLFILLLAYGHFAVALRPIHVLLVGNSLSFMPTPETPELPQLIQDLLLPKGIDIEIDAVLAGGHTLEMHFKEGRFADQLTAHQYDIVIIQPYSIEALPLPACFSEQTNDRPKGHDSFMTYGKKLAELVAEYNPKTKVLLFEPWTYDNGHAWLRPDFPCRYFSKDDHRTWFGGSLAAYRSLLDHGYQELARATGSEIMPIGDLWWMVRKDHAAVVPVTDLYEDDHYHPTYLGSYLAAVYIASRISGIQPKEFQTNPQEITTKQAEYLRKIVQRHQTPLSAQSQHP